MIAKFNHNQFSKFKVHAFLVSLRGMGGNSNQEILFTHLAIQLIDLMVKY